MRTPRKLLTRRDALAALAGAAALAAFPRTLRAGAADQVLATPAVDMHTHAGGVVIHGKPSFDLAERLRRGRFGVVTMAVLSDKPLTHRERPGGPIKQVRDARPGELFAHVQRSLGRVADMIRRQGFAQILKSDDIAAAYAAGKPGMVISVEGADFLEGKIERVQWAYERGVRHLQLVHYSTNDLGDIMTAEPVHHGLTDFGAQVVKECNRLGMIVDVAHASAETAARIVEVSRTPVVLSHGGFASNPRAFTRTIGPDIAEAIFAKGGMMGLWPAGSLYRSIDLWAAALAAFTKRFGADHVGIGTDMEGGINEVFNDYATYPQVVEALLSKGLSVEQVSAIVGGNYLRVFKAVEAAKA